MLLEVLGLAQHVHEGDFVRISVAGEVIESTYHHPYWVVDGNDLQSRPAPDHIASIEQTATGPGRWVDAGDLKPSDLLLLHNGTHAFVESIKFEFRTETTYNFEVDGHHNYAVGDTRVLVHNNSGWRNTPKGTAGKITRNRHHQLTDGKHILDEAGMAPHTTGSLADGKSQFLNRINEKQLLFDGASIADDAGLWVGNKAKIVFDQPIGVHAGTGRLTNVLNIYRNRNGFIHGAPGTPQ